LQRPEERGGDWKARKERKRQRERERERERERNIGRGMNEREEEEEEEEGEPAKLGKKRGRPIINWPRISFVPFFLSVLSRATGSHFFSSVLPEESRDSPMAAAEPEKAKRSDDGSKEEYGGEARRRGGARRGCNLSENLQAAPFTLRDVPSEMRDNDERRVDAPARATAAARARPPACSGRV